MKHLFLVLLLILCAPVLLTQLYDVSAQSGDDVTLLVFSKTEGFRHASIPTGVEAVREIAAEMNYKIDHTEDSSVFTEENLSGYDAVIFLSTTGDILNESQQEAFEQFIAEGGGFVGIHAASDTEYDWPWYNKLVGAYFDSHPKVQEATIEVLDRSHPSTDHLPEKWIVTDEWYNFNSIQSHLNVLANLDESSYEGGKNGQNHPIAWYHEIFGGKAFYTGRGHTDESFGEPAFRQHIAGGIQYVLGKE
ncbi:MAG: ThuA domain-containing protein [Balneolaceae bacterium]|nr:ThuA domain-containing protein [Balneolaceae bacterium]